MRRSYPDDLSDQEWSQIEPILEKLKKSAEDLGLCYKQVCRIHQRFREEGPKGLISKR